MILRSPFSSTHIRNIEVNGYAFEVCAVSVPVLLKMLGAEVNNHVTLFAKMRWTLAVFVSQWQDGFFM